MSISQFWGDLGGRRRVGLVVGACAIVAAVAIGGYYMMRGTYQVLFSGIAAQDAQVMLSELDKRKIPYRLEADGTAILVPADKVHRTRIDLLGQNLPLHGAVGFELFNNADFGMTEFAQRVNYQRALQGEITRTILSLSNVATARVLIALPERGLFNRGATAVPTASIVVGLRDGRPLTTEQVVGIQRLVSASIPDIAQKDVTIANEQGVALSAPAGEDALGVPDAQLSLKRTTEEHLLRKIMSVLDQTFGPGAAVASVDVSLNMDRVRITTEDVLPYSPAGKGQPTGVVVRERRSSRDSEAGGTAQRRGGGQSTADSETQYEAGRRVEEIVSMPGVISKMSVTAVMLRPIDAVALDRLRAVVANAAGSRIERGDTIVVFSAEQMAARLAPASEAVPAAAQPAPTTTAAAAIAPMAFEWTPRLAIAFLMAAGGVLLVLLLLLTRRRPTFARLDQRQREAMLTQLRGWLEPGAASEEKR